MPRLPELSAGFTMKGPDMRPAAEKNAPLFSAR